MSAFKRLRFTITEKKLSKGTKRRIVDILNEKDPDYFAGLDDAEEFFEHVEGFMEQFRNGLAYDATEYPPRSDLKDELISIKEKIESASPAARSAINMAIYEMSQPEDHGWEGFGLWDDFTKPALDQLFERAYEDTASKTYPILDLVFIQRVVNEFEIQFNRKASRKRHGPFDRILTEMLKDICRTEKPFKYKTLSTAIRDARKGNHFAFTASR
jgi:hypothetical protein